MEIFSMKSQIDVKRLIKCRQNMGITQSEAADLIGVSQPAYQRYEAGVRTPSLQVVKEIAAAFNVSVAYLSGTSKKKDPDYIVIGKENAPLLFSVVEKFKDCDEDQLKNLILIERFEKRSRPDILELFEGYQGKYEPVDMDWGEPSGREVW